MKKLSWAFSLVLVSVVWVTPLMAAPDLRELAEDLASELNGDSFTDEFKYENKHFTGDWSDREDWEGTLCNGHYAYGAKLLGRVEEIKAEIKEDLKVDVTANIDQIIVGVRGEYRSELSLCAKVDASHDVNVDFAVAKAVATVVEGKEGEAPKIKLRVTETRFGRIHLNTILPGWFEEWMTDQINKGLRRVWNSRLGEWISEWLSEKLNEKFPGGGENE